MRDLYSYSLSPDQLVGTVTRNSGRIMERMHTRWLVRIATFVLFVVLGVIVVQDLTGWGSGGAGAMSLPAMSALAIGCALLLFIAQRQGFILLVRKSTFAPGAWQLGLDDEGIWTKGPHSESFTRWSGWRAVEEHRELVLLYHDDVHVHPVPFVAFQTAAERREFIEHVRSKIAAQPGEVRAPAVAPATVADSASSQASGAVTPPTFRSLVSTAARLVTFRRVSEGELAASWLQIVGVVLATLLAPLAFAALSVGEAGHVAWMHLPGVLFHVPVMLIAAIMLASLIGRTNQVATLLVGSLLAWAAIDFMSLGLWIAASEYLATDRTANMAFYYAPIAWLALAVARLAVSLVPAPRTRLGWVLAACALFLALPLGGVYRERSLWSMDYSRQAEESKGRRAGMMAAASEESLYRQPELLQHELAALQPGRKGIVDIYFVGVAGYGHQDVFMREVESVATLFRERFDAEGHIVTLVNNPKTVLSQPLASATSLRAALKRVAEVMDADEDVLVLFLTSHGSNDHQFTVQLWPLELKQITPPMLREMLDASGIKNRVVIVSACYAGGFIRHLASENTLVVAAAAPDRNSFGCSNENDWTYFGKAYFDEALRQTVSFTRAFEIAKPLVEEREKKDKYDPSRPQMSLGAAIEVKLGELERQLASTKPAPRAAQAAERGGPDVSIARRP